MSTTYSEFQRCNPMKPPNWRWQRALDLAATGQHASCHRDDAETRRALAFLQLSHQAVTDRDVRNVMKQFPDLCVAKQLYLDSRQRLELECRILARQPPELIAEIMGYPVQAIKAATSLFFDVAERIDASSYIVNVVVAMTPGQVNHAALMRLCAYFHGPGAIDPWLDYFDHWTEVHDLRTAEGRQRESLALLIEAQSLELSQEPIRQIIRSLVVAIGSWRKTNPYQAPATLFSDQANRLLTGLPWGGSARSSRDVVRPTPGRVSSSRRSMASQVA